MGKVKSRRSKGKGRVQPTGLPSVKETERQQALEAAEPEGMDGMPLLDKLSSSNASDRESSCRSLSQLVFDGSVVRVLMSQQVVGRLAPLMVDKEGVVREAAAGALRNLSLAFEGDLCESMVEQGVMPPLSVMLKESVTELQRIRSCTLLEGGGGGEGEEKEEEKEGEGPVDDGRREQLFEIADQGVNLLLNLSEQSFVVVEVFNRDELLPVLVHLLRTDSYPFSLVTTAAQCLHTITEDNAAAVHTLSSSQEHLSFLEGVLAHLTDPPTGLSMLLKMSMAGIFCNLLPSLPPPLHPHILRGVLSVLGAALDTDVSPLLHTLSSTPPPTPPQEAVAGPVPAVIDPLLEDILNTLRATRLALEILANMCYVEDEGEEGEWEDEEEEEMVGDLMEDDSEAQPGSTPAPTELTPTLTVILELGIHEQVWKRCHRVDSTLHQLCRTIVNGEIILKSLATVHSRSLTALQNLVVALPAEAWGGRGTNLGTMCSPLFALFNSEGTIVQYECILGALLAVGEKMSNGGGEFITLVQLERISRLGLTAVQTSIRADVMALLGIAGKMALRQSPPPIAILNKIGLTLRGCIVQDSSLWVVSQALDSVFDVFGDDDCPRSVFGSARLMPVLRTIMTTFKARLRVEGKTLKGPHRALVQNTKLNLPRFVQYMTTRTKR